MSTVLVTGGAGFIGYHLTRKLVQNNFSVIIIDNLDDFYDVDLKIKRLSLLGIDGSKFGFEKRLESTIYNNRLIFIKGDICDKNLVDSIFQEDKITYVVHLAAKSGSRNSFQNPQLYVRNNVEGFINILQASVNNKVDHLLFTSSSSVYGSMSLDGTVRKIEPVSLYGVTKRAAEVLAETYSKAKHFPVTIARLFSVYGPLGRPDGLIWKCIESIKKEQTIELYNNGNMWRDFIYIDDVVEVLFRKLLTVPEYFEVFDLGTGEAHQITKVVQILEQFLKKKAKAEFVPMHFSESFFSKALNQNLSSFEFHNIEDGLKKLLKEITPI